MGKLLDRFWKFINECPHCNENRAAAELLEGENRILHSKLTKLRVDTNQNIAKITRGEWEMIQSIRKMADEICK